MAINYDTHMGLGNLRTPNQPGGFKPANVERPAFVAPPNGFNDLRSGRTSQPVVNTPAPGPVYQPGTNAASPYGSNSYGASFQNQGQFDSYTKAVADRNEQQRLAANQMGVAPAGEWQGQYNTDLGSGRYAGMGDAQLVGVLGALGNSPEGWSLRNALLKKYGSQDQLNKMINSSDAANRGKNFTDYQMLGTMSATGQDLSKWKPSTTGGAAKWADYSFNPQSVSNVGPQAPAPTGPLTPNPNALPPGIFNPNL